MRETILITFVIAPMLFGGCSAAGGQNHVLSSADQAAYEGAIKLKDVAFCDKINDEDYKIQCKTDLNDKYLFDTALSGMDQSICREMISPDHQNACKIQIEIKQQEISNSQQTYTTLTSNNQMYADAVGSGDLNNCFKIEDNGLQTACKNIIYSYLAAKNKDKTLCNNIMNNDIKADCLDKVAKE